MRTRVTEILGTEYTLEQLLPESFGPEDLL